VKTAEAILRIPPSNPELLFSGDEAAVHQLYHRLAAQWHPDRNTSPFATEVFQRIVTLYTAAKAQIASGRWSAATGETLPTGLQMSAEERATAAAAKALQVVNATTHAGSRWACDLRSASWI